MAETTITEYKARPCIKCGGAGFLSVYQHIKAGQCFRCGATGDDPVMLPVVREMQYFELIEALAKHGIIIEHVMNGDYLHDLFGSEEAAQQMRLMLATF